MTAASYRSTELPLENSGASGMGSSRLTVLAAYLLAFMGLVLFFFLSQNRMTTVYDEGLIVTDAMRVMAGQVLHRDFYYNYGPAPLYVLAGLFRIFGPSVLAERLFGIAGSAALVISVYWMVRQLCSRRVSQLATLLLIVWTFGAGGAVGFLPVLILWSTWLIASAVGKDLGAGRALGTGLLVGVATLFRYDMGSGLVVCHVLAVAVGVGLRSTGIRIWLTMMLRNLWAYILGVALVVVPLMLAYLRAGSLRDLLFDIVIYTAKYYRLGRGLPLPSPLHFAQLQDLVAYVLPVLMVASVFVAGRWLLDQRRRDASGDAPALWTGVLIAFSLVAAMLFAKASIRIWALMIFPAMPQCIVMAAVLYEQRARYSVFLRRVVVGSLLAMFFTGAWWSLHLISGERTAGGSMLLWFITPQKMAPRAALRSWCGGQSPVTHGLCFLMDDDHIQTVEFLLQHTKPGDTLYVGLPQHDRVFESDNITYFATWRLPATKWSHFDPYLQNSVETQQAMIADLERNQPPYVVLDSEFDSMIEANGSSVHSGVHLLDDYVARQYRPVERFGEMAVLARSHGSF